jgi:hypothetical protein
MTYHAIDNSRVSKCPSVETTQQTNIALSVVADRLLSKSGGAALTIFFIADPDHDDYIVRYDIQRRTGQAPSLKTLRLVDAAAQECKHAIKYLSTELDKRVHKEVGSK